MTCPVEEAGHSRRYLMLHGMARDDYLYTEKPMKAIFIFSLPMMLGNLFQQFYTMADSIIVGRYLGEKALAAVGASSALTAVFIAIAIGGGAGASVVTSRLFGAGAYGRMKESISTSLAAFLVLSLALAAAGYILSPAILSILNTPEDIIAAAVLYLRIYFLGLPFLFIYNILSSIFNALGKSRIPLLLLIFSSLLNVVLDIAAVAHLGMGIAGAAWATLLSQAISAVISMAVLRNTLSRIESETSKLFSRSILKEMGKIALPSILQQSTINIGMLLVQSVVNGFGSEVLAGYSAAIRVDSLLGVPMSAVGNSMSPYTAQNIGARKAGRIAEGYRAALFLILAIGAIICIITQLFGNAIISLFLGDGGTASAYATGEHYLSFLGWFYTILGIAFVTGGVLRGSGDMRMFTTASIANLSFRVIGSILLAPRFGVDTVWYVVPVGWLLYASLCYISYRKKNWAIISR